MRKAGLGLLIEPMRATTTSTSTRAKRRIFRTKCEANCTGAISTDATRCLDLGLGLLEHGLCDKASLNLASCRLGHDVGEKDLLIVRTCYTALMALVKDVPVLAA